MMSPDKTITIHLNVSKDASPELRRALLNMATAAIRNYVRAMNQNFDTNIEGKVEEPNP